MLKINSPIAAFLLAALTASAAQAGVPRAWVSGHGTDASGCGSPTSPCRSLQYVHDSIINAGGEIDILDPAGYGTITITITKALSIVNDGVGTAGIQQGTAGQNAITINAGANDAVTLRGLNIDGLGTGQNGIVFNSGANLTVVNCVIRHFVTNSTISSNAGNGILIQPTSGSVNFLVSNTIVADNTGIGLNYSPPSGNITVKGMVDHVTATNNSAGIEFFSGLQNGGTNTIALSNSVASNNSEFGLYAQTGSSSSLLVTVDSSTFNNNNIGINGLGYVFLTLGRSEISGNVNGVDNQASSGAIYTYGNNQINLNTTNDLIGYSLSTFAQK
jgi:hypothetical protein